MSTNADKLNKYLKALIDVTDDLYKSIVSDPDGTPESTIVNPVDLNYGCVADLLEWNRMLTKSLVRQLYFDQAEGKFLDLISHTHFGLIRASGETDSQYKSRVKDIILGHKISPASIIYLTRGYSSPGEPQLIEGEQDSAFADCSFTECYTSFQVASSSSNSYQVGWWVFPAIALASTTSLYFFILILDNTPSSQALTVLDIVNRSIAAGIDFEIWIKKV